VIFADPCKLRPPPIPFTLPCPLPRVLVICPKFEAVVAAGLRQANCGVLLNWEGVDADFNRRFTVEVEFLEDGGVVL